MYGLRKPFQSTNPWTIISHEWFDIAAELRQVTGFGTKIKLLFGAPPDTQQSNRWALVTGGSRGIGRKIVQELAGRGFNLVVVALPDADINTVENEIRLNYSVEILAIPIDLTREGATEYIFQTCVDKGIAINILVNNAGLGNHEYFDLTEYDYMDNMMKLNNLGMVRLIYLFLPQLKASRDACIMNVGSMASLSPVPCKAVYSATKSFVYSFSKSLREELGIFGISVSCLLPGGTHTGDNRRIDAIPVKPGLFIQSAEKVAHTAVRQMFRRRFRIIPGYHNHVIYYLWRVMPPVVFKWILRRMFLRKRAQTQLAVI